MNLVNVAESFSQITVITRVCIQFNVDITCDIFFCEFQIIKIRGKRYLLRLAFCKISNNIAYWDVTEWRFSEQKTKIIMFKTK